TCPTGPARRLVSTQRCPTLAGTLCGSSAPAKQPRLASKGKRGEARGSGAAGVPVAGVQRARQGRGQEAERAEPRWAHLRADPGPRGERGSQHAMGRAGPAGTRGATGGDEPSIRQALARAECQENTDRAAVMQVLGSRTPTSRQAWIVSML